MKNNMIMAAVVLAFTAVTAAPLPALAQVNVNITLGSAPPPLRFESVPSPRSGYLWAPGFWDWDGSRHVWSAGHWERVRPDYVYIRPEWQQRDGEWQLKHGGWKQRKHQREEEGDNEGRHDNGHHDNGRHGGEDHCPPGQAKKGNC